MRKQNLMLHIKLGEDSGEANGTDSDNNRGNDVWDV
jgi:hypothetical protein